MKVKIYDYDDKVKEVEIPDDKHIDAIYVTIWSGDETGFMMFAEGGYVDFDASDNRYTSHYYGHYIVDGDNIQKWLNWTPTNGEYLLPYSYVRQMTFSGQ